MEIAGGKQGANRSGTRGVALLMSLSVVLLLSIALMKTFEKRSLEVAQLGQNLDRFQAESLSRSGLKLILLSIKRAGLPTVNAYLEQMKLIEFPIGNGFMKIREITPVDHRFNLNKPIRDPDGARVAVFRNIVSYSKSSTDDYNYFSSENSSEALSAIIDWTDKNETRDTVFLYDSEFYPNEEPSFSVKNREFDRLSEVHLLPAFRSLEMSADFLEQNFRTAGTTDEEFIDVNVTSEVDMERFFKRYEDLDDYRNVFDRSDDIIRLIISARTAGDNEAGSPDLAQEPSPPFPAKDFLKDWVEKLGFENIKLTPPEKELFKAYSNYLFIHYQVIVGRVTLNIRSMIHVEYLNTKKNLDIKTLTILWFKST